MKNSQKRIRLLSLALALVMLVAVVSCEKGGETEATHKTSDATEATTVATTVATTAATTVATTAATTVATTASTMGPTSKTFQSAVDGDGDGKLETYVLYNYLPDPFTSPDTILIKGEDHLSTDKGVAKLEMTYGDLTLAHYYLNNNFIPEEYIPPEQLSLTWKITVPEDGVYQLCAQIMLKNAYTRGYGVRIDSQEQCSIGFQYPSGEALVNDGCQNAFLTGYSIPLSAGEHTLQFFLMEGYPKTLLIRYLYLVKVS